jgi:signal transduction histidine kinase
MSQIEHIGELQKKYLLEEQHANDIIVRFLDDLSSSSKNTEAVSKILGGIDIEFGYRVLLSFFGEELKLVLEKHESFKHIEGIYCACLRANDFNEIDSALLSVPKTILLDSNNLNIFKDLYAREGKFKLKPSLDKKAGDGLFTLVSKSVFDNHLIINRDRILKLGKLNVNWYDGTQNKSVTMEVEKDGILWNLPEWDTMLCSKIKNLGGHFGIGYQFFILIVNFKKDFESQILNKNSISSFYSILSENNRNIINTFSILNTMLLSSDIRKLLSTYSSARLTSLMAINFRHTLRSRLETALLESFSLIKECYPNWTDHYNKAVYTSLSKERKSEDKGKYLALDESKVNKRKKIDETNIRTLLESFNVIIREIDDNKLIQQYFDFESQYNPDNKAFKEFELKDLFSKFTKYIKSIRKDLKISNLVLDIRIVNPVILYGILYNIVLNAYTNCPKNGIIIFKASLNKNTVPNLNNEYAIIEVINQIAEPDYNALKELNLKELFKPFKTINGKRKGMGLYYSYVLLKEYFIESRIELALLNQVTIKEKDVLGHFYKATMHLKNISK